MTGLDFVCKLEFILVTRLWGGLMRFNYGSNQFMKT